MNQLNVGLNNNVLKAPKTPPKYAQKFLHWILKEELAEEVLGDLEEKFYQKVKEKSVRSAKANYYYQTLNYLRPFAIKNSIITDLNPFFMFNSYFKIAWRSLFKHRLYTAINVTGMTIGMTCFILLALYIQYELSYDTQHEKGDRIYRIVEDMEGYVFKGTSKFACASIPVALSTKADIPEVESVTIFRPATDLFTKDGEVISEEGVNTDTSFFDIFSFPVLEGDPKTALKDKNAIILTETMAKKFFGHTSPIGKELEGRDKKRMTVKAVIEDVPANHHFKFSYLTSIENNSWYVRDKSEWNWSYSNYWVYALLKEGADVQKIETAMKPYGEKAAAELVTLDYSIKPRWFLQPLTDIHLHSRMNYELEPNSDIRYLNLSASIAFIILCLALINYMNLATARTSQRAKEVGMRKVLGARKGQLVSQFMAESFLLTLFSFGLSIGLARFLLPFFNELMGLEIPFQLANNNLFLMGMGAVALLLGGLSGLYPAILSSAIAPINALKGSWFKNRKDGAFLRSFLVVGQFTAAIVLATSSLVIYQQLQFIQNKKLGYTRDQIVYIPYQDQNIFDKTSTIRTELLKHPNIDKVTIPIDLPLNSITQVIEQKWEGNTTKEELLIYQNFVDYDFLDLFEIDLLAGRNFSPNFPSDSSNSYILNESAVKKLGWDNESAIGKSFAEGKVIGVMKDFHFLRLDFAIEPLYLTFHNEYVMSYFGNIVIKMNMQDGDNTIAYIQNTLKTVLPEFPFEHRYLDESYNQLYQAEKRFGAAFNIFTLIALFIACIGLFGLVTHHVFQRTKEIGIRKVLGASIPNIVSLISKDFLKLVILSSLIAIPLAWWGMNTWLQDFAYRIDINWWVFVVVGLTAILVAFVTIGSQSLKAALSNPVKAIKSE